MIPTLQTAITAVLPPICPVSGEEVGAQGALSPAAWSELVFISSADCRRCGRNIPGIGESDDTVLCDPCMRTPHRWDRGRAAFQYDGTGRRLILSLKHGDRLDLAPLLAGWMARAAEPLLADADLIIPIPLHWTRRIKRRYNQSAELARQLCAVSGGRDRFAPDFLYRSRRTATQDGRDRDARIANVAAAIKPNPARKTRLVGRKVLLVDDVMTTGATLDAAADACLDAGASSVDVVVSALVNFDPAPYVASTAKPKDTRNEAD